MKSLNTIHSTSGHTFESPTTLINNINSRSITYKGSELSFVSVSYEFNEINEAMRFARRISKLYNQEIEVVEEYQMYNMVYGTPHNRDIGYSENNIIEVFNKQITTNDGIVVSFYRPCLYVGRRAYSNTYEIIMNSFNISCISCGVGFVHHKYDRYLDVVSNFKILGLEEQEYSFHTFAPRGRHEALCTKCFKESKIETGRNYGMDTIKLLKFLNNGNNIFKEQECN